MFDLHSKIFFGSDFRRECGMCMLGLVFLLSQFSAFDLNFLRSFNKPPEIFVVLNSNLKRYFTCTFCKDMGV